MDVFVEMIEINPQVITVSARKINQPKRFVLSEAKNAK